jgi:hypothetical protein
VVLDVAQLETLLTRTFSIGLDVGRGREKVALVRLRFVQGAARRRRDAGDGRPGPGETDRMRCSHGNLDAVAASGTPNPRKEATPDTPAICAVNG